MYIHIHVYKHTYVHTYIIYIFTCIIAGYDSMRKAISMLPESQVPTHLQKLLHEDSQEDTQAPRTRFASPEPFGTSQQNENSRESQPEEDSYAPNIRTPRSVRVLRSLKRSPKTPGRTQDDGFLRDVRGLQKVLFGDADGASEAGMAPDWTDPGALINLQNFAPMQPIGADNYTEAVTDYASSLFESNRDSALGVSAADVEESSLLEWRERPREVDLRDFMVDDVSQKDEIGMYLDQCFERVCMWSHSCCL
jgi:hypothetical protein